MHVLSIIVAFIKVVIAMAPIGLIMYFFGGTKALAEFYLAWGTVLVSLVCVPIVMGINFLLSKNKDVFTRFVRLYSFAVVIACYWLLLRTAKTAL